MAKSLTPSRARRKSVSVKSKAVAKRSTPRLFYWVRLERDEDGNPCDGLIFRTKKEASRLLDQKSKIVRREFTPLARRDRFMLGLDSGLHFSSGGPRSVLDIGIEPSPGGEAFDVSGSEWKTREQVLRAVAEYNAEQIGTWEELSETETYIAGIWANAVEVGVGSAPLNTLYGETDGISELTVSQQFPCRLVIPTAAEIAKFGRLKGGAK
jgi:hypothetical protein